MIETLRKTEKYSSWITEMPSEIAEQEGYAKGSKIILTFENGIIRTEVLPPTSSAVKSEVNRIVKKYGEVFEELKRLGD
ncbi:MAG: hypothetical protein ACR2F2_09310 [Pyrinomonadaceae bacterium]